MKWQELLIETSPGVVPLLEYYLYNEGVGGIVEEKIDSKTLIKAYFPPEFPLEKKIEHWRDKLREVSVPEFSTHWVDEEDWAESWKKFYHPIRIGRNIVVKPSWEEYLPTKRDIIIELDPGMAFGSGYHPTTQLCLKLLEKYIRKGDTILDLGTGSGILAIAALKMGASRVLATDSDPVAVEIASRNIRHNSPGSSWEVHLSSDLDNIPEKFNLITANLISETLINLAGEISRSLLEGGILICSGVISQKSEKVEEAMRLSGLFLENKREEECWTALALKKR